MNIRIAISGIGGVGGYYGGKLANFYEHSRTVKIYYIARGSNLEVIRKDGLQVRAPNGVFIAHPALATDRPADIGPVDYLFCCTKEYDLEENISQLSPLIDSGTVIVPLLNGVDITEKIQQWLPDRKIWFGCAYIVTRLTKPGIVTLFSLDGSLYFGHPTDDKKRQQELLKLLTDAGIQAFNPEDIISRIWQKFFLISSGATITSYYDLNMDQVIATHKEPFFQLLHELKKIADAKEIVLPDDIVEKTFDQHGTMPPGSTTSMHSDFRNGKRTELETLTGYVVNTGKALHVSTPVFDMMYKKLRSSLKQL